MYQTNVKAIRIWPAEPIVNPPCLWQSDAVRRYGLLIHLILATLSISLLTTLGFSTVLDGKTVDISLSTGITHSTHIVFDKGSLAVSPLRASLNSQWILSEPISLDDSFRLPRGVRTVFTAKITADSQSKVNLYQRFSVNRRNWSTWHALTPTATPDGERRFELDLRIPEYESAPYQEFIYEWFMRRNVQGNEMTPMSLTQIILGKDPHWFEKHIPVIRYVQFLIDLPFPSSAIKIHSLNATMSWGTNQLREDLWFENDPVEPRKRLLRQLNTRYEPVDLIPNKVTAQGQQIRPTLIIVEDTRLANQHLCKAQVTNGSTDPVYLVQAGVGPIGNGGMAELAFPPANWNDSRKPLGADMSPQGWFESLGSVEPPATPTKRYSLGWQANSQDKEIEPGKSLQFVLLLDPRENTPCDQLHWKAILAWISTENHSPKRSH